MASKVAEKRLQKEYLNMQKSPPPFIWASPDEKNILDWHFIIRGPPDTPYDGGEYHGLIWFPSDYPFKPPDVKFFTPSGRFQPGHKICMSMTSYHPSTWNAAWSVATILTGLLSFMLSDEVTAGGIRTTDEDKKKFAKESHAFNLKQKKFKDIFPDYAKPEMQDLPDMGRGTGKPVEQLSAASSRMTTAASSRIPTPAPAPPSSSSSLPSSSSSAGPRPSPLPRSDHSTDTETTNASSTTPTIGTNGDNSTLAKTQAQMPPAAAAAGQQLDRRGWFSWRVVLAVLAVAVLSRVSRLISG